MKLDENWNYVDDENKYPELMKLYNAWDKCTRFLSTGNTNVKEWYDLLEYCKQNKHETAQFYLDLINYYEEEHKSGIRANNYVGFFSGIVGEVFKEDGIPTFSGWIPGDLAQSIYEFWIIQCYFGGKDVISLDDLDNLKELK